jgi:hypothetical protein
MSFKKSNFLFVGLAILVTGGLATYVYFRNLAIKVSKPLASAKIVPASAMMTAFISPHPEALAQLQELGTPEAQRLIAGGFKEIEEEALAEANISFEKDIQPWAGSITMALLPRENPAENIAEDAQVLILIGIKNKIKAWNFFNQLKGKEDTKIEEQEYQGVAIWEVTEEGTESYNSAVLGDYLAVTDSVEGMRRAIDTFQGEPSLASQPDAAAIYSKSAGVKNPVFTWFVPDYGALMAELNANSPTAERLSPSTMNALGSVKHLVMAVGVDDAGVRLRTVTKFHTPVPQLPQLAGDKLLANFPAETMALFSGGGISQVWSQFVTQAEEEPMLMLGVNLLREALTDIGLDVDREVFGWMDGEFAMGAIASNEGLLGQVGVGAAVVIETSDRPTAETFFNKLDAIATDSVQVSLKPTTVNGKQVMQWQMLGFGTLLGHGWLDDNTAFIAAGEPIVELMATGPSNPLNASTNFLEITGSLPESELGYFYLDIEQFVSWLERYPYAQRSGYISPEAMVVLNSMRGIGVTAVWPDAYTSEVEMLWALKSFK